MQIIPLSICIRYIPLPIQTYSPRYTLLYTDHNPSSHPFQSLVVGILFYVAMCLTHTVSTRENKIAYYLMGLCAGPAILIESPSRRYMKEEYCMRSWRAHNLSNWMHLFTSLYRMELALFILPKMLDSFAKIMVTVPLHTSLFLPFTSAHRLTVMCTYGTLFPSGPWEICCGNEECGPVGLLLLHGSPLQLVQEWQEKLACFPVWRYRLHIHVKDGDVDRGNEDIRRGSMKVWRLYVYIHDCKYQSGWF